MSYCVNCGVELDDSAKKCALCATPVINPNNPNTDKETLPPFSKEEHIPKQIKARITALIISMCMLVPNIVCILINAIFFQGTFWSLYVGATSFLVWIIFVFPFLTKKLHPYLMWGFDTVSVAFYVFFFFAMGNDTTNWYLSVALPIIIAVSLLVVIYMLWVNKNKRHWFMKTMHIFADIGLVGLLSGALFSAELGVEYACAVGLIIFTCCLSIVVFMLYCNTSKTLKKWFTKRFFT
ncbi:MAG: DUF6320 domain-containing protein [Acutalibacteraceae bacterium]|nr:DUF6320 domain-containing protein [Acutalibacteraceae bacterium]